MHRYYISLLLKSTVGFFVLINLATANTLLGAGLTRCGQYMQFAQQSPEISRTIDSWALGYLSGVNFIFYTSKGIDLLSDQNSEKITAFIQGYCKASPLKNVTEAANEYWFNLAERTRRK